ncbi:MAG: hypothetical protein LUE27_05455, partial [Clostridia bacterium]|nr:hypothetical protein [Clostridia bacterium]
DTVTVRYPLLGISEHLKVVKTVYDTLSETYESITLGTCKSNLLNTISEVSVTAEEASSKSDKFTAAMNAAIENATERVTGQKGGYVVLHGDDTGIPYELLVMDEPAIEDAVSVWRWNVSGLAYSGTGYNGPYETAITADGAIVADFITSGSLTANIIKAGTITSMDGSSYWNLETGEVHLSAYAAVTDLQDVESRVLGISSTIDVLKEDVDGVTETVSSFSQSIEGLTAQVNENNDKVSQLTLTVNGFDTRISDAEGNIATLTQTADSLKAEVAEKVDEENDNSSFGWELLSTGFVLRSAGEVVMSADAAGLSITGHVTAQTGSLGNMEILGTLRFAGDEDYYISGNADDNDYFVYLPGLTIDEDGAKFTGYVVASSGRIGGLSIGASYLYSSKTAYDSSDEGVYLGTDGLGLGPGTFYVTEEGELYASKATISGTINATDGTIGGFVIGQDALTNENGGSRIRILDDEYTTELCASVVQCVDDSDSSDCGYVGWSVSKNHIYIQSVNSGTYSGVEILPYYTKRDGTGTATVYEGCITTVSAANYIVDSDIETGGTTPFILGAYRKYSKSPYVTRNDWGAFLRFANFDKAELVHDSTLGGGWYVRDEADGISYPLSEVIPFLYTYLYSDNAYAEKARTFVYIAQKAQPTASEMSASGVELKVYVATICFGNYYLHCGRTNAAVDSDAWIYYDDTTAIAAWICPSETSTLKNYPTPVCGAYIAPSDSFSVYSGAVYKGRPVWFIDTGTADSGTFLYWISKNA